MGNHVQFERTGIISPNKLSNFSNPRQWVRLRQFSFFSHCIKNIPVSGRDVRTCAQAWFEGRGRGRGNPSSVLCACFLFFMSMVSGLSILLFVLCTVLCSLQADVWYYEGSDRPNDTNRWLYNYNMSCNSDVFQVDFLRHSASVSLEP